MDNHLTQNLLIGSSTADTLANLNSIVALLRNMKMDDGVSDECEYGLFTIYTLMRNALEYEIGRVG